MQEIPAEQILTSEVERFTDEPTIITVDVLPKSRVHKLLMKCGFIPSERKFTVRGASIGTLSRISKVAMQMSIEPKPQTGVLSWSLDLFSKHSEKIILIIALAIHNQESTPPKSLIRFLRANLLGKDLEAVATAIVGKLDLEPFTNTTLALARINILKDPDETSGLQKKEEIIASGEDLESLRNIFDGASII